MSLNKKHEAMAGASGMSDLRHMMGLGGDGEGPRVPAPKRKPKPPKPRLSGVARELYELMGDNAPAIQLARPKVKGASGSGGVKLAMAPKLLGKDGKFVRHWGMEPFVNQARADSLALKHWVPIAAASDAPNGKGKASSSKTPMYPFAKYNVASNVYEYTDEEYAHCLSDDPTWSRQETDHLFALCRKYDLRWVVIADRFDEPIGDWQPPPRRIEELKDRYYLCCRHLIRVRPAEDTTARDALVASHDFQISRELQRKDYLRSLINRTPAQIAEEEFLYLETRRLEQAYASVARDRESLLRMLAGPGALATLPPSIGTPSGTGPAALAAAGMVPSAGYGTPRRVLPIPPPIGGGQRGQSQIDPALDAQLGIERFTTLAAPVGPTCYLRSTRVPAIRTNVMPKVTASLAELGISTRLVMPTRQNQGKLDELITALGNLVEIKRQVERAEYEAQVRGLRTIPDAPAGTFIPEPGSVSMAQEGSEDRSRTKRSLSVSSSTVAGASTKRKR